MVIHVANTMSQVLFSPGSDTFFSFSVWIRFFSKVIAQKVSFGIFVQHFNLPNLKPLYIIRTLHYMEPQQCWHLLRMFETSQNFRPITDATLSAKHPQQHATMSWLVASVRTGLYWQPYSFMNRKALIMHAWIANCESIACIRSHSLKTRFTIVI